MTPLRLKALSAAHMADLRGGMAYTVGGWIDPDRPFEYHAGATVTYLVGEGYLAETGRGKSRRRIITEAGRQAIAKATR